MKAEKHSFPQITLCWLEFRHNRSSKIICYSQLKGMTNTVKTSSRTVLWYEVGCNLFRCQNILVAPSFRNPKKISSSIQYNLIINSPIFLFNVFLNKSHNLIYIRLRFPPPPPPPPPPPQPPQLPYPDWLKHLATGGK